MKITFLLLGRTDENFLQEGIEHYRKRIVHYLPFDIKVIPPPKGTAQRSIAEQIELDSAEILKHIESGDRVVLLDEKGREGNSREFAGMLQNFMNQSVKNLVFVVGGPFGSSEALKKRADMVYSLSKLTYSHQLVRMVFCEQLYRGLTIIRGERYHHD